MASGGAVTGMRARSTFSCAATSATWRIHGALRAVSNISRLEHEWSPAIALSAAQSMHEGVVLCSAVASGRAQALFVAHTRVAPQPIEHCPAFWVQSLQRRAS